MFVDSVIFSLSVIVGQVNIIVIYLLVGEYCQYWPASRYSERDYFSLGFLRGQIAEDEWLPDKKILS